MATNQSKLSLYLAANALSWSALGFYTVSLSWLVLSMTNSTASVGLFYLLASASSLLVSPLLSPLLEISAYARYFILLSGMLRSASLTIPFILTVLSINAEDINILIFLVALFFGPSNSIFSATSEGLMLRSWSSESRARIAKRTGLIRQLALASGFAAGGFLVAKFGAQKTSAFAAALGLFSVLISLLFKSSNNHPLPENSIEKIPPYLSRVTDGLSVICATPKLVLPCIVATLGFSVSQMSNALLAPIVTAQHKTASQFGLITSAWAIGAITAAILANLLPQKSGQAKTRFGLLIFLGAMCILFSCAKSTPVQIAVFSTMGAIFSYLRIMSGADIALHTPSEKIAKVQLTLSNLVSLTALVIYTIPWLLSNLPPTSIFAIWGITIVMTSLGIIAFLRRGQKYVY